MNVGAMAIPRPLLEGSLRRLGFPDLLQCLSVGEPCQILFMERDKVKGILWLAGRLVVRAQTPKRHGAAAFLDLFRDGNHGGFRVFALPSHKIPPNEGIGDLMTLLMRAAWALEEGQRAKVQTVKLPDVPGGEDTHPSFRVNGTMTGVVPVMDLSKPLVGDDTQPSLRINGAQKEGAWEETQPTVPLFQAQGLNGNSRHS